MHIEQELRQVVEAGVPLTARYPLAADRARARARLTTAPSLAHFGRLEPRFEGPWPALPGSGARGTRPPRVAIATPDIVGPIRNGGIGTAYTSLAKALADAGHDVTILFTLGRHAETGGIDDWIRHYHQQGIRFVPLPEVAAPAIFHGPGTSFATYRWLASQDFDVIHFPEWGGTGFCSLQAKRVGLAFEHSVICVGVHSPTIWHDLEDRQMVHGISQLERDFLERRSVELADVVVSPSQYLLRWTDCWGWRLPERTYVHPYIAPTASVGQPGSRWRRVQELVFFGRLESRKGVEIFCDAIDRLAGAGLLSATTVTFLGKPGRVAGTDGVTFIRERAAGWTHNWQVITDRGREEALEYLLSRDALAVTPSLADNTPNTVLECLGAGVPFLAAATGGIPEMIAPADWGHALVEPRSDALALGLRTRLETGATASRPASSFESTRLTWVAWHEDQVRAPRRGQPTAETRRPNGPLVSVCMATHNRSEYLEQAMESLRRQTYCDYEVVLVDDGSDNDDAIAAIDRLRPEFERRGWTLLRAPHAFPGAARNTAAAAAKGRYLLFMDDDNLALPGELETLVRAAEASESDVVTCAHEGFTDQGGAANAAARTYRWLPIGAALPLGLFVNCIGDTNMLVRREVFFAAGGFDEEPAAGLFEDWTFLWKAAVRGSRIEVVPEVLYLYRVGAHGSGQRSPAYESYQRPLRPVADLLPGGLALGLLFAAAAARPTAPPPVNLGTDDVPTEPRVGVPVSTAVWTRPGPQRPRDWLHRWMVGTLRPSADGAAEGEQLAAAFARNSAATRSASTEAEELHFKPINQVHVERVAGTTRFHSLGSDPQAAVVPTRNGSLGRGPLLVRLDITSPAATYAQLFWRTVRMPFYCESQSIRTPLRQGRNVRYVRIPVDRMLGHLRFDIADIPAELVLHDFEVRSERSG